jgi:hypothetical protein
MKRLSNLFSLPMKINSTPLILPETKNSNARQRKAQSLSPRRSTIMMLRQFARAYSCATTLPAALGSMIAN